MTLIPPIKPLLPPAEKIFPYLQNIDSNRYYTNFGPLVQKFEERFSQWLHVNPSHVLTTSNGTTALEIAIKAYNPPAQSYAIMPSWTFCATAHAVLSNDLIPFFSDVDPDSWALTPDLAEKALALCPGPVSLVLPVCPFGLPLPIKEWEEFHRTHNIDIVMDGAALLPHEIQPSASIATIISLHATKVLCAGEGGIIIKKDENYIKAAKDLSNFGITDAGIQTSSGNKKMSEYHAAVAHASMDEWEDIEQDFMRVAKRYHANLSGTQGLRLRPGYGTCRYNSNCMIETVSPVPVEVFHDAGIGTRKSWRQGCHREPLFNTFPSTDVFVTENIVSNYAGIPCYRDLPDPDIDYICEKLLRYIEDYASNGSP